MNDTKCKWCGNDPLLEGCDCQARIECSKAGTSGHFQCGWCRKHDRPVFKCTPDCWSKEVKE